LPRNRCDRDLQLQQVATGGRQGALARRRTTKESFVDVSPSTVTQLKDSLAATLAMRSSALRGTPASVHTKASSVAMSGRIMPAPLAMPSPWLRGRKAQLAGKSLRQGIGLMIASAADSQLLLASSAFGSAAVIRSAAMAP